MLVNLSTELPHYSGNNKFSGILKYLFDVWSEILFMWAKWCVLDNFAAIILIDADKIGFLGYRKCACLPQC